MHKLSLTITAATLAFIPACGAEDVDAIDGVDASFDSSLSVPAGEVDQILNFLNDVDTTAADLDDGVRLNSLAAFAIITHRDGRDGVYPSQDDNPFETLGELDAVPYVGTTALTMLRDFVAQNPTGPVEIVETVQFSPDEIEGLLWGLNQATEQDLLDAGLDPRAAKALVENAPYATATEIGAVYYVGPRALALLRDQALSWLFEKKAAETGISMAGSYDSVSFDEKTARIAFEIANSASAADLIETGDMWTTGANRIVAGRPYKNLYDVASREGIGNATMEALHRFAVAGTWTPHL